MALSSKERYAAITTFQQFVAAFSHSPRRHSVTHLPDSTEAEYFVQRFFGTASPADDDMSRPMGDLTRDQFNRIENGRVTLEEQVEAIIKEYDLAPLDSPKSLERAIVNLTQFATIIANGLEEKDIPVAKRNYRLLRTQMLEAVRETATAMMTYPEYEREVLATGTEGKPPARKYLSASLYFMREAASSVGSFLALHSAALEEMLFSPEAVDYQTAQRRARFTTQNEFNLGPTPG